MDPEYDLPFEGDLQMALDRGDNFAIEQISKWREHDRVSFSLPRVIDTQRGCEVEITFLDRNGIPYNSFCGKADKLNQIVTRSNTFFVMNIPLKKFTDESYILEDDARLIGKHKKLIGIPVCKDVYSLVEKEDYDNDYVNVYYSLHTRIFWKIKNRISNISFENFKSMPERDMLEQINNLVKSHTKE